MLPSRLFCRHSLVNRPTLLPVLTGEFSLRYMGGQCSDCLWMRLILRLIARHSTIRLSLDGALHCCTKY